MEDRICYNCGNVVPERNVSQFYMDCPHCKAITQLYEPQEHQIIFHKDPSPVKALLGGFGSGKSLVADAEIFDHLLRLPGANFLVLAPTIKLIEQTEVPTFLSLIPPSLIKKHHKKDNTIELVNGSTLLFFSSEDEQKLRSLNLTGYKLEEASAIKKSIFEQLPARLRHPAANKKFNKSLKTNQYLTIICSNPANNWIRTDVLLKSNKIYASTPDEPTKLKLISSLEMGNCNNCYQFSRDPDEVVPFMSTHIHTSFMNKFLPEDFIERQIKAHDEKWVDRFIYGSFDYADGAVYPTFRSTICEPFPIPDHFPRIVAMDFGGKDPTAMAFLAIDPDKGDVYFYDEYYETSLNVKEHSERIKPKLDAIPQGMMLFPLRADPSGRAKQISTQRSLFDHYAEYGIYCTEANNAINAGLAKVATYIERGKLKVFSTCTWAIKEGSEYAYDLDKTNDKPVGGFDHLMDCLRYAMVDLPDNPADLIMFVGSYFLNDAKKKKKMNTAEMLFRHALDLDEPEVFVTDWYNN